MKKPQLTYSIYYSILMLLSVKGCHPVASHSTALKKRIISKPALTAGFSVFKRII